MTLLFERRYSLGLSALLSFSFTLRNGSLHGESLHFSSISRKIAVCLLSLPRGRCERDIHFTARLWLFACRRTVPVATGLASLFLGGNSALSSFVRSLFLRDEERRNEGTFFPSLSTRDVFYRLNNREE